MALGVVEGNYVNRHSYSTLTLATFKALTFVATFLSFLIMLIVVKDMVFVFFVNHLSVCSLFLFLDFCSLIRGVGLLGQESVDIAMRTARARIP